MNNIAQALRFAFTVSSQDIIGYSNTASIMRLAEQAGAGASTSPDEMSQQERLAQAVWILNVLKQVCTQEQVDALACRFGYGSDAFCEGAVRIAQGGAFGSIEASSTIKGLMLQWMFGQQHSCEMIAKITGKNKSTVWRWAEKAKGEINGAADAGQLRIEAELIRRGFFEFAA